jgi:hypothetical protein
MMEDVTVNHGIGGHVIQFGHVSWNPHGHGATLLGGRGCLRFLPYHKRKAEQEKKRQRADNDSLSDFHPAPP